MARRARAKQVDTFSDDLLLDVMGRYDELVAEKNDLAGEFLRACKDIADRRKDLFKEAKSRGLPTKILRKNISARDKKREAQAIRDALDADYHADFDRIAALIEDDSPTPVAQRQSAKQQADKDTLDDFESGLH